MSAAVRGTVAHAASVARLVVGFPRSAHNGALLGSAGAVMGLVALFSAIDPDEPEPLPLLSMLFVVAAMASVVMATWRTPTDGEPPVLPVGDRTRALVDGGLLTATLGAMAVVLRAVAGVALGRDVVADVGLFASGIAIALPLVVAIALPRRPHGPGVAVLILGPLLILTVGAGSGWLARPWAAVATSAGLTALVLAVGPALVEWRSPRPGRSLRGGTVTARAGLPGETRILLDLGHGLRRRLLPALGLTAALWAAAYLAEAHEAPTLVGALVVPTAVLPRLWALLCPLDLGVDAVRPAMDPRASPWELLPVSPGTLARALGTHALLVTGSALVLDVAAAGVAWWLGGAPHRLFAMLAGLGLVGVAAGAMMLRVWVTGRIGWLGVALLSSAMVLPVGAALGVLVAARPIPEMAPWAGITALSAAGWVLLAWDTRRLARR